MLIIFIFPLVFAYADLVDHYKPAIGKDGSRSIRNVDFIYIINLDQRPEKYKSCLEKLAPYNIKPYRFSAVNGWELKLETINDVGVKLTPEMTKNFLGTVYLSETQIKPRDAVIGEIGRTYFCHKMPRGSIGIVLSHLSILHDAFQSGYETIWVMEDDIEVIRDPRLISDYIEKLDRLVGPDGWDILFTDQNTKNKDGQYVHCKSYANRPNFEPKNPNIFTLCKPLGRNFFKIGARYGAYSMIVRRSGMKKLLDFFDKHKVFLPFDMDFYLPQGIQLFTVSQDIVSTEPRALSDNGRCGYLRNKQ
ncbi:MAG: glycosyltransferase family 25 protein [Chlamydiales bacterium]|nr:glycosyltransferase family 25 protein [Chlamydiales bacterium]